MNENTHRRTLAGTLLLVLLGLGSGMATAAVPGDADGDGLPDLQDNCPALANASQCDSDSDGHGNHCDVDLNNDGIVNAQDTAQFRLQLGQPSVAPTYNKADLNCNGAVNAQDNNLFRRLLETPPVVVLSGSPTAVTSGASSMLTWSSTNANGCTASGGWSGGRATSGSTTTGAVGATTTYSLTCAGTGGSTSKSATVTVTSGAASRFPLRVEAGKRYLVDAQGRPFLMHGDTPWTLITQLTETEIDQYLEDRRVKGFNTILIELIENLYSDNAPRNVYGDAPFATGADFATRNEAYFSHAEYVIARAREKGMLVLVTPAYLGYNGGSQGWYQEMGQAGNTVLQDYGRYVATRFQAYDNVLWVHGGDYNPPDRTRMRAIVNGILEIETTRLHTFHGARGTAALQWLGTAETWLDVNNIYTIEGHGDRGGPGRVQPLDHALLLHRGRLREQHGHWHRDPATGLAGRPVRRDRPVDGRGPDLAVRHRLADVAVAPRHRGRQHADPPAHAAGKLRLVDPGAGLRECLPDRRHGDFGRPGACRPGGGWQLRDHLYAGHPGPHCQHRVTHRFTGAGALVRPHERQLCDRFRIAVRGDGFPDLPAHRQQLPRQDRLGPGPGRAPVAGRFSARALGDNRRDTMALHCRNSRAPCKGDPGLS